MPKHVKQQQEEMAANNRETFTADKDFNRISTERTLKRKKEAHPPSAITGRKKRKVHERLRLVCYTQVSTVPRCLLFIDII